MTECDMDNICNPTQFYVCTGGSSMFILQIKNNKFDTFTPYTLLYHNNMKKKMGFYPK